MSEKPKTRCRSCAYAAGCASVGIQRYFAEHNIWVCGDCGGWFGTGGKKVPVPKCEPLAKKFAKKGMLCQECFSGFSIRKLQELQE